MENVKGYGDGSGSGSGSGDGNGSGYGSGYGYGYGSGYGYCPRVFSPKSKFLPGDTKAVLQEKEHSYLTLSGKVFVT